MAPLLRLPAELFNQVTGDLDFQGKLSLSCTCSRLRELLAPHVFAELRVANRPAQCASALAAARKYGHLTTALSFTGHARPEDDDGGRKPFEKPVLPKAAVALLSGSDEGSAILPNLRRLRLRFAFGDFDTPQHEHSDKQDHWDLHPDNYSGIGDSIYVFFVAEDVEYARSEEDRRVWRALMKEVWAAASANRTVRHLALDDFQPKLNSSFVTDQHRAFVARLESLDIAFCGGNKGTEWMVNTCPGYNEFVYDSMGDVFFRHARSLRRLRVCSSTDAFLGESDAYPAPLPLVAADMPALEALELENYVIGGELAKFLAGRSESLASITLRDCLSALQHYNTIVETDDLGEPIGWAEFFSRIRAAGMERLSEFVLDYTSSKVNPLTREQASPGCKNPEEPSELELAGQAREILRIDPARRVFGYLYTDTKYGFTSMLHRRNCQRIVDGRDQQQYDALMAVVQANADRLCSAGTGR